MLETRLTPAVIYGEMLGMGKPVSPPTNPVQQHPDTTPPIVTLDNSTLGTVSTNPAITGTETDVNGLGQADAFGLTLSATVTGQTTGGVAVNNTSQVIVSTSGQFSFTPTTQDGTYTVTFVGHDAAGNASKPVTATFTLSADTIAPVVTITSPPDGQTFATNPTITGTAIDNVAVTTLTASVDNGPAQAVTFNSTTGAFTFTPNLAVDGTADGSHTVTFTAKDAAGNTSTPASVTFTLTTTNSGSLTLKLDPASDTGTAGDNKTTLATVTLDGTAPDNTVVTLTQTGATTTSDANGNYTFTNVALKSGPNTFNVTATGPNGNLAANLTVTLDTAPTVSSAIANFQVSAGTASSIFNMPTVFEDQDVNTVVQFTTNRGTFEVELFGQQTPVTVANFISYVEGTDSAGSTYNETIFHRVTNVNPDQIGVLQGGGFKLTTGPTALTPIATAPAITLEAGLTNALGTIAMARTNSPDSATSQFFFNTVDNSAGLDLGSTANPDGFAVFGVVLGDGMSVIDASAAVPPVDETLTTNGVSDPSRGAFGAIPLSGGFPPNDPNFPGDTAAGDYEVVQSVTVASQPTFQDSLTFAVSNNSNPSLVTPTINSAGLLTLAYASGQTGTATITLTATDSAGAEAQTSFTVTVGADTQAPTVTITSPTNGASVKTSPDITGTATDNLAVTTLTASVDNGPAQPVTFSSTTGAFTFNPGLAVDGTADGSHTVTFTATDAAGNTSTPASVTFTLDTVAPTVTITSPADGQSFATNPTITGTAIDNVSLAGLTASVDGGAAQTVTVDAQGNFSFTPDLPTDGSAAGSHTVTFIATDAAGNTSTPATLTFTLTAPNPAVTLTAPTEGQAFNTDPAFAGSVSNISEAGSLTASVDGGTPVAVTVDGQGNFTFTPSIATDGSADGTHTVTFSSTGQFTAVTRSFVLDTTGPVITLTSPADGQTFAFNPTLVGTVVDATTGVENAFASVDGGQAQTLNVDAQGNFTFIPPVASGGSQDGPHTVTITAVDAVGNASTPVVFAYTLDTVGPAITITSPADGISDKVDPDFIGTVTDANGVASLTVSVDGGAAQTVTFDSQGNFSFDPGLATDGSADGAHTFTFVAKDNAGNQSTVTQQYTLDTTPPTVTITSPADGQTFMTNPTIQGSATDNIGAGFVNVFVDGVFTTGFAIPTNGPFTYTTTLPLDGSANGPHTVSFVALDAAGNQSAPATLTFTLDSPGPAVTLTAPAAGQAFNTVPAFTGSVANSSEAGSLTASVDGGAAQAVTVDGQGNFSFTPSIATDGSADGTHTVTFSAGGQFIDVSRSFVLDTVAPAVTVTSPANGQTFSTNPDIIGSIVDATSGVATATASVDGGAAQTLTLDAQGHFDFVPSVPTDGSADGPHTVTIAATDAAGNAAVPVVVTYTLDTVHPAIAISSPAEGISSRVDPVFTGTVTDSETPVTSLTVSVNGGAAQNVSFDSQGNFTFDPNLPTDGSADGFYTFTFVAVDGAGNQSTVTRHYTLDTTPPTVTLTTQGNGQTFSTNPTIQGSATDNIGAGFIDVFVDGVFTTGFAIQTNGSFSYTTNFALDGSADGPHTITFVALDAAGNQSAPVSFDFVLLAP